MCKDTHFHRQSILIWVWTWSCGFSSVNLNAWVDTSIRVLFRDLQIVRFQRIFKPSRCHYKGLEKLSPSYFPPSSVLHVSCSFLSLPLSPNIFSLFSPPSGCTCSHRQNSDTNAHLPCVSFKKKKWRQCCIYASFSSTVMYNLGDGPRFTYVSASARHQNNKLLWWPSKFADL